MLSSEKDILFVGYGAMLVEGFVAIMALVAACVLVPADYFAITTPAQAFASLKMTPVHLPDLATAVGEQLQGRAGGAVSLAVGMAYIFSAVPFMKGLMGYWYHFAIMFEAVFILTAVDTGTRVGRYMLRKCWGGRPEVQREALDARNHLHERHFHLRLGLPGLHGEIGTIWPLFGMSNQLLAIVRPHRGHHHDHPDGGRPNTRG